ncbi:type I-C CRISPR-associated protein Cas5c [Oscillibacter sp.]|uniref:type I-C CRISPR-associated protein Cas5c n=1 Tax=Oscillibacter sp. TaxID=1945593 RepID=UPI0028A0E6F4|nr:type I-C CRISPR-associated protein Cas5c [Oscillibacter sp.]
MDNQQVTITIWGRFALFSRPESKVERMTYPVPTPSGIRGVLASIYSKPAEFYWQVRQIEVLNPIQYATFRRNEVKSKLSRIPAESPTSACIEIEEDRTQRQAVVLKDVRYRVTAEIVPRPDFEKSISQLYNQFERRVKRGQMFVQPCMGTREFPAYFEWGSTGELPFALDMDLGLMVYDVFDLNEWKVGKQANPSVSLYRAQMKNGVIEVPQFDSPLVLKPEKR